MVATYSSVNSEGANAFLQYFEVDGHRGMLPLEAGLLGIGDEFRTASSF
jgi:hypothetical protein